MKEKVEVVDKMPINKYKEKKPLSLDEIEQQMLEYATDDTTDPLTIMVNEKKISMLEKVANLKLKRLQLKELEKSGEEVTDVKPLEIKFVSSKTEEQKARLERIDQEICESRRIKQNA